MGEFYYMQIESHFVLKTSNFSQLEHKGQFHKSNRRSKSISTGPAVDLCGPQGHFSVSRASFDNPLPRTNWELGNKILPGKTNYSKSKVFP